METRREGRLADFGLWLAPLVHGLSFWLMLRQVEPFYTAFYSLAWWSYILFLSALNHRRRRNSLLFDRPREFAWIFLISTPIWLFFELCNFRLQNWHYLGVPEEWWIRWPGVFVAFGTVLPGLFETQTLLQNLGLCDGGEGDDLFGPVGSSTGGARTSAVLPSSPTAQHGLGPDARRLDQRRPQRDPWGMPDGLLALLGGLMLGLALVWPGIFFPLVWVGPLLVLPWLLRICGADHAPLPGPGDVPAAVRLLVSGLLCGFLWEFWNFWAGSKWIYSIPYLNAFRVFEMPVAGFLGFPPFALICFWMVRILGPLRPQVTASLPRAVVAGLIYLLFCGLVILGIEEITVLEYKPLWIW